MNSKTLLPALSILVLSCKANNFSDTAKQKEKTAGKNANSYAVIDSIPLPPGYKGFAPKENSFAEWLGKIKLKESKTVYLFNGSKKLNQQAQFAVLDISVGNKDLQQCADAVMRLRAEYLFTANKFESISFADNEGGVYLFSQPYSREHLHTYLQKVFGMCGSASLSKQLRPATIETIKPGDVFIRGGFPGHAAIVMDVAANAEGKRIFMLAQSYMPAQDIHVLANPMDKNLSPWYEVNDNNEIVTPEYVFKRNELKSWAE